MELSGGVCSALLGQEGLRLTGGESAALLGPEGVKLTGGAGGLELKGGRAELNGDLYLNGRPLYDVVRDILIDLLG